MRELFLDANAHMPMHQKSIDAFINANNSLAGHGHALSPSNPGRAAEKLIEDSRAKIAEILGADRSTQIIFTSTCTQACAWGLEIFGNINEDRVIYMSPAEHPAVRQKAKKEFKNLILLKTNNSTVIDLEYPIIKDSGVICIHVQNEIGIVQPVQEISANSLFVDMSQVPGKMVLPKLSDINNIDIAVFGAHKFQGPSSVGFMYLKNTDNWSSNDTGSRYFLDRPGTPDACSIAATAAALEHCTETLYERTENMLDFRSVLEPGLEELGFEIIGKDCPRIPGTTFAKVPKDSYSHFLMLELGKKNIHIGLGSACGSVHSGTSPLMKILSNSGSAKDFIRISQFGEYNANDAKYLINILKNII